MIHSFIDLFSNYFQQYFQIFVGNQIYRSGKLILLSSKEFYIKFIYIDKKNNKQKHCEIPIPYNTTILDNKIILDYTNETFCNNDKNLLLSLQTINNSYNHHAFYNKKIIIKFGDVDLI